MGPKIKSVPKTEDIYFASAFSFLGAIKEMKLGTFKFLDKFYIVCLLTKTSSSSFLPPRICGVTGNLNLNKTEFSLFSPNKPLIMGEKFKSLFEFPVLWWECSVIRTKRCKRCTSVFSLFPVNRAR